MPIYRNRPAMSADMPVRRYQDLDALIQTVRSRRLRFTRVDKFEDNFEGSVPQRQIADQVPIFVAAAGQRAMMAQVAMHYPGMPKPTAPEEDPWARMTRLRRNRTRCAHASCWSAGDESELLWRYYGANNNPKWSGIAMQTTLGRLEASVGRHDLYVSPITYLPYHEAPSFSDEMDTLLHKRDGFAAEREVRLLRFDEAQFRALLPQDAGAADLPEHVHLDWNLADVIEEIVISPYPVDPSYEEQVREAIERADPRLSQRIKLSVLHERRYPPGF